VASTCSISQHFAYHTLKLQIIDGSCPRLLCCIVQTFRFSFCRIQFIGFAAHQNIIDTSSGCIQENRASTLGLPAVGARCFQLTSCSPLKLMTAGSGRNRGEPAPRLNHYFYVVLQVDNVFLSTNMPRSLLKQAVRHFLGFAVRACPYISSCK